MGYFDKVRDHGCMWKDKSSLQCTRPSALGKCRFISYHKTPPVCAVDTIKFEDGEAAFKEEWGKKEEEENCKMTEYKAKRPKYTCVWSDLDDKCTLPTTIGRCDFLCKRDLATCWINNTYFTNKRDAIKAKQDKENREYAWLEKDSMTSSHVIDELKKMQNESLGLKNDDQKRDWMILFEELIPALEDVVKVMEFGAKEYARHNWKYVKNGKTRYLNACLRHIFSLIQGEVIDPDSNLPHLAHLICDALFLLSDKCIGESNGSSPTSK